MHRKEAIIGVGANKTMANNDADKITDSPFTKNY
jgi:hypothetical protein